MTTSKMYNKGLRCKGRGFNCDGCNDKNECIEYEVTPFLNYQEIEHRPITKLLNSEEIEKIEEFICERICFNDLCPIGDKDCDNCSDCIKQALTEINNNKTKERY